MRKFVGVLIAALGAAGLGLAGAVPASGFAVENPRWTVDAGTQGSYLKPPCGEPNYGGYPATTCYVSFQYSADIRARSWDGAIRGGAYNWCNQPDPRTTPALNQDFCYEDYTYNTVHDPPSMYMGMEQRIVAMEQLLGGKYQMASRRTASVILARWNPCRGGHSTETSVLCQ